MKVQLLFGLIISSLFALNNAKIYNFNVISILGEGYSMGVKYGKKIVPLKSTTFPLFSGNVEVDRINEYNYVALNNKNQVVNEEVIKRIYSDSITFNEVYNRTNKHIELPELPKPFQPIFPLGTDKYKPFPNNEIFNVYAKCNETGYAYLTSLPFLNGKSKKNEESIQCHVNIVSPNNVFESDATMKIVGFGSRKYKKLSWNFKFSDGKFLGRKAIKMRGIANDPSLMREKLATEVYKSVGVPVQEGAYARLFINGDTFGLYLMNDSFNKKWIGAYLHGDDKASIGITYKMDSSTPEGPYADFRYLGTNYKSYKNGVYEADSFNDDVIDKNDYVTQFQPLINFTKTYADWVSKYKNDKSDKAVTALQSFLDIEAVLRVMAVDTLVLPLDNFWLISSNTALYYNSERNNYNLIPYDFDQSLVGSWDTRYLNPKNYIQDCITWANYNETLYEHYFTNNLLVHPQIKNRYDTILAEATRTTFDSQIVAEFLQQVHDLIQEDVLWNVDAVNHLSIPYEGKVKNFSLSDFERSLNYKHKGNAIRSSYELWEYVDVRSGYCKAYTEDYVVTESLSGKNVYIPPNDDKEVDKDPVNGNGEQDPENDPVNGNGEQDPENDPVNANGEQDPENDPVNANGEQDPENDPVIDDSKTYEFRVVSILGEGYKLGVKYNDNVLALVPSPFPLFTGNVTDAEVTTYKYVVINNKNKVIEEESLERTYTDDRINEVYNRENKVFDNPKLPDAFQKNYPLGTENFQPIPSNVIYNVYAKCDDVGYANLTANPFIDGKKNDENVPCKFTILSPDITFESEGTLKLVGFGSRKFKKLSWNMKFKKNLFLGRKAIKMRGIANDQSLMREKLAVELYKAAGVPVQEGAFARLFINNDIYGLYMINDSFNTKWVSNYIHGSEDTPVGFSYKMDSSTPSGPYADLKYLGTDYKKYRDRGTYEVDIYDENTIKSDDLKTQWAPLINFTKQYANWVDKYKNDKSIKAVVELQKFLDIENLLRLLAIDTLILPLDNFWLISGNTAIYYNTERNIYQFIPYDFDQVMHGSWEIDLFDPKNYIKDCITWANYNESVYEHYFVNNILVHPQIKERYDEILAVILSKTYRIDVVTDYLQILHDIIKDDVQWNIDAVNNLSIPYDGYVENFTMSDFEKNLNYKHKDSSIRTSYKLWEFVGVRSSYCKDYVTSLGYDLENLNIAVDEPVTTTVKIKTTSTTTTTKTTTTTSTTTTTTTTTTKTKTRTKTTTKTKTTTLAATPTESPTKIYQFSVISLFTKDVLIAVKYDGKVVPLTSTIYPLFVGTVEADDLEEYQYIALKDNKLIEEESFVRNYSTRPKDLNEVFNRRNKSITIPNLPTPFTPQFKMGTSTFQNIPDNIIYNIYAECDETVYNDLVSHPFINDDENDPNDEKMNCSINIVAPTGTLQSEGTFKLSGYGSRYYKKLSWNVKLDAEKFYGRKAFKLRAVASDASLMREKVASKIYSSVGVPVTEGAYARLIINNDVYGLYILSDSINQKWISSYIHGNENSPIGISYNLVSTVPGGPYANLRYIGDDYVDYEEYGAYEIDEYNENAFDEEDESSLWTPLVSFIKVYDEWVKTYKNDKTEKAVNALASFLNIESTLRLMAVDTLILPLDNFWIIMSNTVLYYNPERKYFQFIPSDFEQSMYGSWEVPNLDPVNYMDDCITWANYNEDLFDHYFINNLMSHPLIEQRYKEILGEMTRSTYDSKNVLNYVNSIASLIQEDVEWNFEAVQNLHIPYKGIVEPFDYESFENNLYETFDTSEDAKVTSDYYLNDFIVTRSNKCKAFTEDVYLKNRKNISN